MLSQRIAAELAAVPVKDHTAATATAVKATPPVSQWGDGLRADDACLVRAYPAPKTLPTLLRKPYLP
jgi:hypothetical protein